MKTTYANGVIAVAGLLTAGCASVPRQELWDQGQMPPANTYAIGGTVTDEQKTEFVVALGHALETRGFRETDNARYLVQIVHSDRPGRTRFSIPDAEPAEGRPSSKMWGRAPRRSERVREVTISISGVPDGRELYRLQGTELYRPGKADDGGAHLTDAMKARIAGP